MAMSDDNVPATRNGEFILKNSVASENRMNVVVKQNSAFRTTIALYCCAVILTSALSRYCFRIISGFELSSG